MIRLGLDHNTVEEMATLESTKSGVQLMDLIGMVTSYLPDKDMLQLVDIFPMFVIRFEHSICYYVLYEL